MSAFVPAARSCQSLWLSFAASIRFTAVLHLIRSKIYAQEQGLSTELIRKQFLMTVRDEYRYILTEMYQICGRAKE